MDPLTALSLACNVIQVVDFAIDCVQGCRILYEKGFRDEHGTIEKFSTGIAEANKELQDSLKQLQRRPGSKPTRLEEIAVDASSTAGELKIEINKLKLSKSQGLRRAGEAFKTTLKTLVKSGKISKLQQKLENQEQALRSLILKELYMKIGQDEELRKTEFKKLSQGHQAILDKIVNAQQSSTTEVTGAILATEARIAIRLKAQDTKLSTAAERQEAQSALLLLQQLEACKRRVLNALSFPEMKQRQNMIESRVNDFGDSCRWIFSRHSSRVSAHDIPDTDSETVESEPSLTDEISSIGSSLDDAGAQYLSVTARDDLFTEWLERGHGPYWITGKPGSGKSSLMNYIFHHLQQKVNSLPLLQQWAGYHGLRLIAYWFFRPASSPLLKTLQGFWRSVCFQLLDIDGALPDIVRDDPDGTAPGTLKSCLTPGGSSAETWTDRELETWAHYLFTHSRLKYFLLVDGLDEIEGDRVQLLEAVESTSARHNNLKICCASRPESPFIEVLNTRANLRLHTVNYDDIHKICNSLLKGTKAEIFVSIISERAQGVFLWASLVTKELAQASKRGATMEDLEARLEGFPDEMGDLFDQMLRRMDKYYRTRPKPYLRLLEFAKRRGSSVSLFELLVAALPPSKSPDWSALAGKFDPDYLTFINQQLECFWSRVEDACAGLVQCSFTDWRNWALRDLKSDLLGPYLPELEKGVGTDVTFIHTSVLDFFQENDGARAYLTQCAISDEEAAAHLALASAMSIFFSNSPFEPFHDPRSIDLRRPLCQLWHQGSARHCTSTQAMLDAYFVQCALRGSPSADHCRLLEGPHFLPLVSRNLSATENIKFSFPSTVGLGDLVALYIERTPCKRRGLLAAFALCSNLRSRYLGTRPSSIISAVLPFIEPCKYTFVYGYKGPGSRLTSTGTILDHLCLVWVENLLWQWRPTVTFAAQALALLEPLLMFNNDTFAEIWCGFHSDKTAALSASEFDYPRPGNEFDDNPVFLLRVWPKDVIRPGRFPVRVIKYRLPGAKEFVELSDSIQQRFRASRTEEELHKLVDNIEDEMREALMAVNKREDSPRRGDNSEWGLRFAHFHQNVRWWVEEYPPMVHQSQHQDPNPRSEEDMENLRLDKWHQMKPSVTGW